ncbi:Afadin and alpha-actinin-binding protein A [Taenia solium]|eukprot:TsM_000546500 transcript=TsM_000546500 gene=TsM_000546500
MGPSNFGVGKINAIMGIKLVKVGEEEFVPPGFYSFTMSVDVRSQCEKQYFLLDLISSNGDCDIISKLEVQWNKHLHSKLQALSEDLVSMGLVPYLRKSDPHTIIINFNDLITAFYELLERHLQCLNAREDADINIRRLTADLEHSRKMHDRCKDELQSTRNAVHQAKERERRIGVEKATLANQLRASKEALRRQQSDSQLHSAHLQRKMNKLEKENVGLKNRLNALLEKPAAVRRFPSTREAVKSVEPDKISGQLDLTRSMLEHLRSRENELFQENRELRDLVSVLSSRILLFTRHLRRKRRRHQLLGTKSEAQLDVDEEGEEEEETSLDCGSDTENGAENGPSNTSSDSSLSGWYMLYTGAAFLGGQHFIIDGAVKQSPPPPPYNISGALAKLSMLRLFRRCFNTETRLLTEVESSVQSQLVKMQQQRRQSANVRHLLLEMPFHLVRDQLVCRVHRLSRRLWREIKSLGSFGGALSKSTVKSEIIGNQASSTDEASVGRRLQEQLSLWKLTLAQCEEEWRENDLLTQSSTSHTPLSSEEVLGGGMPPPRGGATDAESCQDETVVFEGETAPRSSPTDGGGGKDTATGGLLVLDKCLHPPIQAIAIEGPIYQTTIVDRKRDLRGAALHKQVLTMCFLTLDV